MIIKLLCRLIDIKALFIPCLMKHLFVHTFFALLILMPLTSSGQRVTQFLTAQQYNEMKPGPEKIQAIKDLERRGWYHQDAAMDHLGNALVSDKVDLSPFVDELGESVFLVSDISPEFPGGTASLKDYQQNLLGDLLARSTDEVQNTLFIKFSVLKDGKIDAVEAANPFPDWIPASTIQRCMAAVRDMPVWSPGIFNEEPVKVKLMINFSLRK